MHDTLREDGDLLLIRCKKITVNHVSKIVSICDDDGFIPGQHCSVSFSTITGSEVQYE